MPVIVEKAQTAPSTSIKLLTVFFFFHLQNQAAAARNTLLWLQFPVNPPEPQALHHEKKLGTVAVGVV